MRQFNLRNTAVIAALSVVLASPAAAPAATKTATTPAAPTVAGAPPANALPEMMAPYGPGGFGGPGAGPGMMRRGGSDGGTFSMPMMGGRRGVGFGFDNRDHRRGWLCAGMITIVLLLIAITVMLAMLLRGTRRGSSALEELERRFAAGEIDEQDFQTRRAALRAK